jgi:hypothetical protein
MEPQDPPSPTPPLSSGIQQESMLVAWRVHQLVSSLNEIEDNVLMNPQRTILDLSCLCRTLLQLVRLDQEHLLDSASLVQLKILVSNANDLLDSFTATIKIQEGMKADDYPTSRAVQDLENLNNQIQVVLFEVNEVLSRTC